jgi:hypothetical protein
VFGRPSAIEDQQVAAESPRHGQVLGDHEQRQVERGPELVP